MILGKKNKYLITGGACFLGKELIDRLKKMNCYFIRTVTGA